MIVDPLDRLLDAFPRGLRVGLLANQVSYSFHRNRYAFEEIPDLRRVFLPEHGLFAELQDQIPIGAVSPYQFLRDVEWVSLYGEQEGSLYPDDALLSDLDLIVVDLQDVGARYYTFLTSVYYTMQAAQKLQNPPAFCIVDRPNPAGRVVEGTPLEDRFASFVGVPGVLHRHGLTAAELLLYYRDRMQGRRLKMIVIPYNDSIPIKDETGWLRAFQAGSPALPTASQAAFSTSWHSTLQPAWTIPPSPNMPSPLTPMLYAGQCLLEGTNVSEGRGTTRPFEIFGASFIDDRVLMELPLLPELAASQVSLRPLRFIPTFHKFAGQVCNGWQAFPTGRQFHSLLFSIDVIRFVRERCADFRWRTETYEYRDDLSAIEMLAGDGEILGYLNGQGDRRLIVERMHEEERRWADLLQPYVIYEGDALVSALEKV